MKNIHNDRGDNFKVKCTQQVKQSVKGDGRVATADESQPPHIKYYIASQNTDFTIKYNS